MKFYINILLALFLWASQVTAQVIVNPYALQSSTVDLDALSNQVLIWDISDDTSITTSAGKIVTVTDKSGNGNNMPDRGANRASYHTGGANGKPYVQIDAGTLFYVLPTSYTTSPLTIYSVIQLPSDPANTTRSIATGASAGENGMYRQNASGINGWEIYVGTSGISFNRPTAVPIRTDVMLVKMLYYDDHSFSIEVNDEPVGRVSYTGTGSALSIFGYHSFHNITNLKVYETRVFSEAINSQATKDLQIKSALIDKYAITRASGKTNLVLFGDSHTEGIQSGTGNTLGAYKYRLVNTGTYNIVDEGYSGAVIDPGSYVQNVGYNFIDRYPINAKSKWADFKFIINFGTNDSAIRGATGAPNAATLRASLGTGIQALLDAGVPANQIFLVTPPFSTGSYVNGNLANIYSDILTVQVAKGVQLIDWYQAMIAAGQDINTVVGGDGIHGNDAIHTTLYNLIVAAIP